MCITIAEKDKFNAESVDEAVKNNNPIEIYSRSLPRETDVLASSVLKEVLEKIGLKSYFGRLNYCLSEISSNALKANVKRMYFKEKNLDINNLDDYKLGMQSFRDESYGQKNHYFALLEQSDLYIKFSFTYDVNDCLIIEVRNNTLITPIELERVQKRFENVHQITTDEFDGDSLIDESEGAGLGIRSILLALESFGLDDNHYQLFVENNETVSKLIIEKPTVEEATEIEEISETEEILDCEDLEPLELSDSDCCDDLEEI